MQKPPNIPIDKISAVIGTGPENIIVKEDFLTEEEIQTAFKIIQKYPHDAEAYHSYFLGQLPEFDKDDQEQNMFHYEMGQKMISYARSLYPDLEIIQDKGLGIVVHPKGTFIDPHTDILDIDMTKDNYETDTYESQVDQFPFLWSGHLSVLAYLNDDYEGGDLYFPDHGVAIKPKRGSIITFPGNAHYIHGVKPTTSGIRYTISQWCRFKDFSPRPE